MTPDLIQAIAGYSLLGVAGAALITGLICNLLYLLDLYE